MAAEESNQGDPREDRDADHDHDGEQPKITLDRYMSRRRPPVRSNWMQIVSLIAMLAALVMIFMFKDRCGIAVSGFLGGDQQQGSPQRAQPTPE